MKTKATWFALGCLAVTLGLVLAWQRLSMRPLQAELEVLRDQQQEIGRLRAQHERLAAMQIPETELQRLRSDRAAISRMRGEVDALRQRTEERARPAPAKAPERFTVGTEMPATDWRNAGAATPAAALETVLWAAAGGEMEAFAQRIKFDPAARKAALELLQSLPPGLRARHSSPEQLMAFLSIKDIPIGTATVTMWNQNSDPYQVVSFTLSAVEGKPRRVQLMFVREGEDWKLRATEAAVAKYVAALRGQPASADGGK